ncbi:hypothetical protein LSAT2_001846 [Lamellibrachia satsuma]|nr:hypothetical protein LSAT2_001846 [Lamellibrachia satsuma]
MNKYADYCPTNEVFMMRRSDERITSTHCRYESNFVDQRRNVALETYGNESKCFEQFGMWIAENPTGVIHASRTGSGCYRYKCNPVDDTYAILVTTQRFQCTYSWQVIKMKVKTHSWTHHGTLMCPPYSIICQMKTLPSVYHLHQLTPEDNNRHREVIFMSSAQVSAPDFFCCVVGIIILECWPVTIQDKKKRERLVVDLDIQ